MRISDWSSDVCSSDLLGDAAERTDEVDLDDPVERIEREMLDAAVFLRAARGLDRVAGARAVDEDAFLAVRFACFREGGVDRCVVGDVALAKDAAEFGRDREALFFLQVEDHELDALRRESARGGDRKSTRRTP